MLSPPTLSPELAMSQRKKRLLIVWNARDFSAPKTVSRTDTTKITSENIISYFILFYFTFLNLFQSRCSLALTQGDVAKSRLIHSSVSLGKKYLLQSDKGKPWSNKMQQQQGKTNWCHLPKSRNLKNDDQDWPQWDWGDVWFSGVFFKVWHILVTSLLFAFKNLFHCVCWPVMHEKCCDACPVLVLHAERAEEWQLLMVHQAQSPSKQRLLSMSKNTWEMEPKEVQNLLPLQMAEIQLSFCLTDAMKSRLQSRQGNLFLELS